MQRTVMGVQRAILAAEGGGEPAMKALDGKEPEPYIFEGRLILRYI